MKRILLAFSMLLFSIGISAQDLETIIKKNFEATGGKTRASYKTLIAEGSMSQMGMMLDMKLLEKRPDKLKMITTYNGMEIVQMINGTSGYMVNPMTGSAEAINLSPDQVSQIRDNSLLSNSLESLMNSGSLSLTGSSEIAGEPVFELKKSSSMGDAFFYISKNSYYTVAMKLTANQNGQQYNIEARMKDFTDYNGVKVPLTTETYINGTLSGSMTYKSIKFDVPISDSEFEIK
jgi:outer membrane lipoprotein-sorting protein